MDDTWVIQQQLSKQAFLDHINSIDPAIKFTAEGTQGNRAIPFLDILITSQADNSLSISVNHKPTHTDQYLQWDSHHCLSDKYSVIDTLIQRAKTVCTDPEQLLKELTHLRVALGKCNYPSWAINRVPNKVLNSYWEEQGNNIQQNSNNNNQIQANNNQGTSTATNRSGSNFTVGQLVIAYLRVQLKVSNTYVAGMVSRYTLRATLQ